MSRLRRLALFAAVALTTSGCASLNEDYLTSINPFRRAPPQPASEIVPGAAAPVDAVPSTMLPLPRPAQGPTP